MKDEDIEKAARRLQRRIYKDPEMQERWDKGLLTVADMVDPQNACRILGIDYQEHPEFDSAFTGRPVAGLLDRQQKLIAVATKYPGPVVRFTAAHELGHWVLHPQEIMHRDGPIESQSGARNGRSREEREADYFAACFLMPSKSILWEFQRRFGTELPLRLNEDTAFWLNPRDPDALICADAWKEALVLAGTRQFDRYTFPSMAECFKVSRIQRRSATPSLSANA